MPAPSAAAMRTFRGRLTTRCGPLSSLRYGNSTQIFITAGAAGSVGVFGMMSSGRESDLRRRRGHCGRETAMPGRLSDVAAAEVFGRTLGMHRVHLGGA